MKKIIKKCNACGALLKEDEKECPICGYFNDDFLFKEHEDTDNSSADSIVDLNSELDIENVDDYLCSNCNEVIVNGSLVCPNCHSIFVDSPIYVEAKDNGYILKDDLDEILSDIDISDEEYDSIINAFDEDDIDVIDDEDNEEESYKCSNCGCLVSESDDFCPNCGLYFDDDSSIDFIQEMKEYLLEEYEDYYVKEQTGFVGIRKTKSSRYYLLYFSEKNGEIALFYRVNSLSANKYTIDVTDRSLKEVKTLIDVIMSFYTKK